VKQADIVIGIGKNWYIYGSGVVITINAHSYVDGVRCFDSREYYLDLETIPPFLFKKTIPR
jgi:hypothetical protein